MLWHNYSEATGSIECSIVEKWQNPQWHPGCPTTDLTLISCRAADAEHCQQWIISFCTVVAVAWNFIYGCDACFTCQCHRNRIRGQAWLGGCSLVVDAPEVGVQWKMDLAARSIALARPPGYSAQQTQKRSFYGGPLLIGHTARRGVLASVRKYSTHTACMSPIINLQTRTPSVCSVDGI